MAIAIAIASLCAVARPAGAEPGSDLIGTPARAWQVESWLNSPPLSLAQLRGKVVLVRWWTAPDCPFCAATAPSLNALDAQYRARGLQVIGFYHHKADSPLRREDVARYVETFHFRFPVAIDPSWQTLKQWWWNGRREWTSVSFLIDRRGVIRHIHPGGKYEPGDADYAAMQRAIERLLAEPG
jgi:peroxiredoxin